MTLRVCVCVERERERERVPLPVRVAGRGPGSRAAHPLAGGESARADSPRVQADKARLAGEAGAARQEVERAAAERARAEAEAAAARKEAGQRGVAAEKAAREAEALRTELEAARREGARLAGELKRAGAELKQAQGEANALKGKVQNPSENRHCFCEAGPDALLFPRRARSGRDGWGMSVGGSFRWRGRRGSATRAPRRSRSSRRPAPRYSRLAPSTTCCHWSHCCSRPRTAAGAQLARDVAQRRAGGKGIDTLNDKQSGGKGIDTFNDKQSGGGWGRRRRSGTRSGRRTGG